MAPHFETAASFRPRPQARHVVFDFDGTLSLVRAGWAEVMLAMFLDLAPAPAVGAERWRKALVDDIDRHTGRPTIHQMEAFAARVAAGGGTTASPAALLDDFSARLGTIIARRAADLAAGRLKPDDLTVPGSRRMLEILAGRGLVLHLASGTELIDVRREARLLGLDRFFAERIHGPNGNDGFSKGAVIDRIAAGAGGAAVIAFGDGPVEIAETRRVGGLAVAVASDEGGSGTGLPDPGKRRLLLAAGADAVVADYAKAERIVAAVFGEGER